MRAGISSLIQRPGWVMAIVLAIAVVIWGASLYSIVSQVGHPFPGFFYTPDRTVSAITPQDFNGWLAGLRPWDRIVQVNGQHWREMPRLVREADLGGRLVYTVERGNQRLQIAVPTMQFNNDGDLDVLGADVYNGEMAWWENAGNQSFTKHSIDNRFYSPTTILATDINNDGFMDVLGAGWIANEVAFWVNDGDQNFTKQVVSPPFIQATSVVADDIDNDWDVDILGTAASDVVAWWEQVPPPNIAPVANFGPITGNSEGSVVSFDGSPSTDPDEWDDIISYEWDFGDGTTGSGVTPSHTYADNGSYAVCLTVTDTVDDRCNLSVPGI